ncbi:MAG: LysR family transcriptional regulator [Sneathiella sp.]|nr:LysR family transcriptional regulator [Sneathiella sp.]
MDFLGIREFISVVENRGFTAASKKLKISVAQVSRQVSALEDRLGAKLLQRTTRKVTLTELGTQFYQQCRPLVDALQDAENSVMDLQRKPVGTLRLTAPVAYGERILSPIISDFSALYPELTITVELSNQRLDLVEGGYDVAIRLGQLQSSSLIARKLKDRTLYVCAAPEYLDKYGTPHSLSELKQHNCLLGTLDHWRLSDAGKTRNVTVTGNIRCNSGPSLLIAALKANGIVQLPDYYVAPYLESGELVPLLQKFSPETEGIWAVYPENRHMLPKVKLFIDYLTLHLSEE